MLKPAMLYKEELLRKFSEEMYSDRYFYYCGYPFQYDLPKIVDSPNDREYAVISNDDETKVIGYIAYREDSYTSCAYNFGLSHFSILPFVSSHIDTLYNITEK